MKEYSGTEATWFAIGLLATIFVGWLDLVTGSEISFSIFYLIPVGMATMKSSRAGGIVVSVASAGIWLLVETILRSPAMFEWAAANVPMARAMARLGPPYSNPMTPVWNAGVRLGFFLIFTFLMTGRAEEARRKRKLPRQSS